MAMAQKRILLFLSLSLSLSLYLSLFCTRLSFFVFLLLLLLLLLIITSVSNHATAELSTLLETIGLEGSIPSEIRMLPSLRALEVDRNRLTDMDGVRDLRQVHRLTMGFNNFSHYEEIPLWLGELTELRTLGLSETGFSSTIPWESVFSKLTSLSALLLDDNDLSGDSEMAFGTNNSSITGSMTTTAPPLRELYLQGNSLEGSLNGGFLSSFKPSLEVLDLSNNHLTGRINTDLFSFPRLQYLDLRNNYLEGRVLPEEILSSPPIKHLSLRGNFFDGIIPASIGQLLELRHFDVSDNRLGPIEGSWSPADWFLPGTMGRLTNLETLMLSGNNYVTPGPIPPLLRSLTNLKQLSLKATARTGAIPEWIGTDLTDLVLFDGSNNQLNSTIPSSLSLLTELRYLLLDRNTLNGHIPPQLKHIENLKMLLLDQNNLTGDLHHVCRKLEHLSVIRTDCGKVQCDCCAHCCPPQTDDDDDETAPQEHHRGCSHDALLSMLKPSILLWDDNNFATDVYNRPQFNYSADVVFVTASPTTVSP